ncbi:rRNA maturation RNase YbeY [Paraglaciecola sp. MB-3u-78]|uniref:rRNA maturation RNase YbeY n=1 Tax=Paraglaciecola sp. MB-3u-78 TaxID=2058332 RepID=UPI000C33C5FE|nr:rRNA maturation RNase YbeY [Paraglaciecola sp. MB-3u-78]PKG96837.1 rRNA maturation RNase YbeY [Paraglaciecola sp. MB-3u-78]
MSAILDLQLASDCSDIPTQQDIQLWLDSLLSYQQLNNKEITVRIVDDAEIQQLNQQYRGKDQPTNVLSFPFELPELVLPDGVHLDESISNFLGDIVICAQVVKRESKEQNKIIGHHWAHMLIHGTLHLLGYDHIREQDAEAMEGIEIAILQKLAIDDPYQNH